MELVQEFFVTASIAIFFSFLVAKLVSIAMAGDFNAAKTVDDEIAANEVRFEETESKVEFVGGGSGLVEEILERVPAGEVLVESSEQACEMVELLESSPEEKRSEEDEISMTDDVGGGGGGEQGEETGLLSDGDDWEGVETSELERVFAAATNFVGSGDKDDRWSNDVEMELYGLHKIAVEGPCHEPQPMPLKLSARAKWNAWQRLGNMSREVAMEQYITLLSNTVPGWMKDGSTGEDKQESSEAGIPDTMDPNLSKLPLDQINSSTQGLVKEKPEPESGTVGDDLTGAQTL